MIIKSTVLHPLPPSLKPRECIQMLAIISSIPGLKLGRQVDGRTSLSYRQALRRREKATWKWMHGRDSGDEDPRMISGDNLVCEARLRCSLELKSSPQGFCYEARWTCVLRVNENHSDSYRVRGIEILILFLRNLLRWFVLEKFASSFKHLAPTVPVQARLSRNYPAES